MGRRSRNNNKAWMAIIPLCDCHPPVRIVYAAPRRGVAHFRAWREAQQAGHSTPWTAIRVRRYPKADMKAQRGYKDVLGWSDDLFSDGVLANERG